MTLLQTPKLGINLMATSDAQKETVFNEAAISLDIVAAGSCLNILNAPPSTPSDGDVYIVGTAPSGEWDGHTNAIAFYYNGWRYIVPAPKMKFWNANAGAFYTYDSSGGWTQDAAGTPSSLDDLTDVSGTAPNDGDVLTYNHSASKWGPAQPAYKTLSGLSDVQLTTLTGYQVLQWNATDSKWENTTLALGATHLSQLTDVHMPTTPENNQVLTWDGTDGYARWGAVPTPSVALANLTDVNVSGAAPNDVLAFNGSAWGPSTRAITYSFSGMTDGPGSFTGGAGKVLAVDDAETQIVFKTPAEFLSGGVKLQGLADVTAPTDAQVGQLLQLTKVGSNYVYNYYAPVSYAISIYSGSTLETSGAKSIVFDGFTVSNDGSGNVTVQAANALGFKNGGTPITGAVTAVNFLGAGMNVTLVGSVLNVEVDATGSGGSTSLAGLSDVSISSPADGNLLSYDGTSHTWKAKALADVISSNEYEPATYEFGPFAPPTASMFNSEFQMPSGVLTYSDTQGLVVQPGAQTSSAVKHAIAYHDISNTTAPYQITARVIPSSFAASGHAGGIVLQRGANGAFVFLAVGDSSSDTEDVIRFGWVDSSGNETLIKTSSNSYNWLRLGFDGNNFSASVSGDGLVWESFATALSASSTLGGTPTRAGITNRSNAVHNGSVGVLITYYDDMDYAASARTRTGVIHLGLGDLSNVDFSTPPTNGQTLAYDSTSGTWKPSTAASGSDGLSVLNGASAPTSGDGLDGDFWINTSNWTIYGPKTSGAWGSGTSLVGPAGTNGTNGTNGADGKTVLNGSGAPSSGLGVDGDFYIDTSAWGIYGPKASGAWGSGTSLIGSGGGGGGGVSLSVANTWMAQQTFSSGIDLSEAWINLSSPTDNNWRFGYGFGAITCTHIGTRASIQLEMGAGTGGTNGDDGFVIGNCNGASILEVHGASETVYITGTGGLDVGSGGLKVSGTAIAEVAISGAYSDLSGKPDLRALNVQSVTAGGASVTIDASAGEYVILTLEANVTTLTIANWLGTGKLSKVTLEVRNTGAFNIENWAGAKWAGGTAPTVTSGSGKYDRYVLSTGDGGTTVYGDIIGQAYA